LLRLSEKVQFDSNHVPGGASNRSDCHSSNQSPSALLSWLVMLIEQQIAERRERAAAAIAKILERPAGEPYGDYRVQSASGKTYRVAMRGPGLFENYCSCPDFAVNTLGTCKHIEGLLARLRERHGRTLDQKAYARTRASISLQYGETIEVRLRLPASPSSALRALADEHFD